jgi:hypothetical protein
MSDEIAGIVFKRALAIAVMAAPRVLNSSVDIDFPCLGDFAAHDEWLLFRFKTVSRVASCLPARTLVLRRSQSAKSLDRGERHPLKQIRILTRLKKFRNSNRPRERSIAVMRVAQAHKRSQLLSVDFHWWKSRETHAREPLRLLPFSNSYRRHRFSIDTMSVRSGV